MSAQPNTGMQPVQFDNPMGVDGFEFVEFAAPDPALLHTLFPRLGFSAVARHRRKRVTLYRQGDCHFLVNEEPGSFAAEFARRHGPSACGFAIRFSKPAAWVREQALGNGAAAIGALEHTRAVEAPVIEGIGGCMLYLIDRYGGKGSAYDAEFEYLPGVEHHPRGYGLTFIDHLTHNLHFGRMEQWSRYYERLFNFREIRYFSIEGKQTGLFSRALTSPCGKIRIPINESQDDKSQIEEYLNEYKGEGIQHIALATDDIYATVDALRAQGIEFQDTPDTYYEGIDARVAGHREKVAELARRRILIDGSAREGILLQIFTKNAIGPIFFEIIQRKGNQGFGEGNFQALFESIELDQKRRGVI